MLFPPKVSRECVVGGGRVCCACVWWDGSYYEKFGHCRSQTPVLDSGFAALKVYKNALNATHGAIGVVFPGC